MYEIVFPESSYFMVHDNNDNNQQTSFNTNIKTNEINTDSSYPLYIVKCSSLSCISIFLLVKPDNHEAKEK